MPLFYRERETRLNLGRVFCPLLFRVEITTGLLNSVEMFARPNPDAAERLAQAQAEVCELVFNFWRDDRVDCAHDQAVPFHLAERLREHLLANSAHRFADPTKPHLPVL